ncbi:hypothetical protein [Nocardioides baekrokdamisoli]|uniref:hypothetical protein n=1 Tax=Nocardioides baekrokdamisoli TaxID=1804624 RepID=UPI000F78E52A|nr:hypothetical protein [Nocardioides baekrokdamisoli]
MTTKSGGVTAVSCRGPISTLSPGGVIVTVSGSQFVPNNRAGRTDTVVDGQRVEIKVYAATQDCPAGATATETLKAYPPTPGRSPAGSLSEFDIDVCYNASGSPGLATEVDRLVRGVRFH